MARLVLMYGLPGSDKTAAARRRAQALPALRLAPDEWMHNLGFDRHDALGRQRVESMQWQLAQALLRLGTSVVLESGFWSRRERDSIRLRARELGAQVELHLLSAAPVELLRRLDLPEADPTAAGVTHAQLAQWSALLEPSDAAEVAMFDLPMAD